MKNRLCQSLISSVRHRLPDPCNHWPQRVEFLVSLQCPGSYLAHCLECVVIITKSTRVGLDITKSIHFAAVTGIRCQRESKLFRILFALRVSVLLALHLWCEIVCSVVGSCSSAVTVEKLGFSELNKNPVEGFSAGLIDDNDIYRWEVLIIGPPDTL